MVFSEIIFCYLYNKKRSVEIELIYIRNNKTDIDVLTTACTIVRKNVKSKLINIESKVKLKRTIKKIADKLEISSVIHIRKMNTM